MAERWKDELLKLRQYELPHAVFERARRGSTPAPEPRSDRALAAIVAVVVAIVGGVVAWQSFVPGRTARPGSAPSHGGRIVSSSSPSDPSDIVFVLEPEYRAGETIDVRIRNVGEQTYLYETHYQACFLTYTDGSGREFIIPPGTHCDILAPAEIGPGETKTLFTWHLDECLEDAWGCQKSGDLPPGVYTIRGSFKPKDGGQAATASITFRITEP